MKRKKILYICGSLNQTTQMHQISKQLEDHEAYFTPFYATGVLEMARRLGFLNRTILGGQMASQCRAYLRDQGLSVDERALSHDYDLVVTCTDQLVQANIRRRPIVLVQEGILDPVNLRMSLGKRLPLIPRWWSGTAATGQSRLFRRFCVASEGYRQYFISHGLDPEKILVTGIPNFDDCERYHTNDFPRRDYVLVCTSDMRETTKRDDRKAFIRRAVEIARGRPLIFKLHPNENLARARREIAEVVPGAPVFDAGSAEEMVANAEAVICQYSSLIFVAMALGKECYSYFDLDEVRRLLPVQNQCAAENIAEVCREVLAEADGSRVVPERPGFRVERVGAL